MEKMERGKRGEQGRGVRRKTWNKRLEGGEKLMEEEEEGKRWEKRGGWNRKIWEEEISRETERREGRKRTREGAVWKRKMMTEVKRGNRGEEGRVGRAE